MIQDREELALPAPAFLDALRAREACAVDGEAPLEGGEGFRAEWAWGDFDAIFGRNASRGATQGCESLEKALISATFCGKFPD